MRRLDAFYTDPSLRMTTNRIHVILSEGSEHYNFEQR